MNWKKCLKPIVMILYSILICVSLPFVVLEFQKNKASGRKEAWFIGGIFVMGAVPISLWTIMEHVINYTKPHLQRHIIRILWMVPIYALNAWFALEFRKQAIYLDTMRECYEAYVIYNFMAFLLNFLRHEYSDFGYMIEQKPPIKNLCPFCCCRPWAMGRKFINRCRHGVLQYTFIRPITTLIAFICEMCNVYHENEFRLDGAFFYLNIINNVSQVWAMYALIMFYRATKTELKPLKPVSKFICVKFVVFLSFWQSVLFAILTWTKVISKVDAWKLYDPNEISLIFQNFFVCIEMFIAAIAHHFSFSVAPYRRRSINSEDDEASSFNLDENRGCCLSCLAMCDVSDVQRDMVDHVKHVGKTVKSKLPLGGNSGNEYGASTSQNVGYHNESTPLIHHREDFEDNDDDGGDNIGEIKDGVGSSVPKHTLVQPHQKKIRLQSHGSESIGSVGSLLTRTSTHDMLGANAQSKLVNNSGAAMSKRDFATRPSTQSMNNQLNLSNDEPGVGGTDHSDFQHDSIDSGDDNEGDPIRFNVKKDEII